MCLINSLSRVVPGDKSKQQVQVSSQKHDEIELLRLERYTCARTRTAQHAGKHTGYSIKRYVCWAGKTGFDRSAVPKPQFTRMIELKKKMSSLASAPARAVLATNAYDFYVMYMY